MLTLSFVKVTNGYVEFKNKGGVLPLQLAQHNRSRPSAVFPITTSKRLFDDRGVLVLLITNLSERSLRTTSEEPRIQDS